MSKQQTDKSRFQSKYSPDTFVSASQYVTELICEKYAEKMGKRLPPRFWNLDEWSKHYKQQIPAANKLLKTFSIKAIINALNSKASWGIYSLRAPHLLTIIKVEQRKIDSAPAAPEPVVSEPVDVSKRRGAFGNKTTIAKLKELDL